MKPVNEITFCTWIEYVDYDLIAVKVSKLLEEAKIIN